MEDLLGILFTAAAVVGLAAFHPTQKRVRRVGVSALALSSIALTLEGLANADPEGRLFAAGFGLMALGALCGALVVLRGERIPLWSALSVAALLMAGGIMINCVASLRSETSQTDPVYWLPYALAPFGAGLGIAWLLRKSGY
jgi:hypothetical protein